jgi:LysM repeat protein
VVQAGDTLIYIASQYGTTVEEIMQANGLDEASVRLLHSGQELLIPSRGPVGGPAPADTSQPPQVIHEVQSGETLISIAIEYGTTTEAIMDANQMDSPDLIYEGQQIIVPLMPPTATPTVTPSPTLTPTPGPPYPAPQLLSPPHDAVLAGEETAVFLVWTSVDILPADHVYLVELQLPGDDPPLTHATQGTSWRLPPDLWLTGRQWTFTWRVTVMRQTGLAADGSPEWQAVSLPSEERRFEWR